MTVEGRKRAQQPESGKLPVFWAKSARTSPEVTFVLIHGLGLSHRSWQPLAECLALHGSVLALDLPGFGAAQKPAVRLTVEEYTAAVGSTLDDILDTRPGPFVVVGHSLGAQIALEFTLRRPKQITQLVLIGAVVDPAAPTVIGQAVRLLRDFMGEPPRTLLMVNLAYLHSGLRQFLAGTRSMLNYPTADRIKSVTVPTLILRGGKDPIAPASWSQWLSEQSPTTAYQDIPGAHHNVIHSTPAPLAAAILTFLTKNAATTTADPAG